MSFNVYWKWTKQKRDKDCLANDKAAETQQVQANSDCI